MVIRTGSFMVFEEKLNNDEIVLERMLMAAVITCLVCFSRQFLKIIRSTKYDTRNDTFSQRRKKGKKRRIFLTFVLDIYLYF